MNVQAFGSLVCVLCFGELAVKPGTSQAAGLPPPPWAVYIGTYTGAKSRGIYRAEFDPASGQLTSPVLVAETPNPAFLALHPNGRFLYAANEVADFGGQHAGSVTAFRIESGTGQLTQLNQQPSGGSGPCHLSVDRTGKCVLVANYGSGSVAALPLGADGRLAGPGMSIQHRGSSVNPQRQEGPHAHFIVSDPRNERVLACDLGLDQVLVYRLAPEQAALTPNQPPTAALNPGAGPRHLVFHPGGRFVYVVNEMGSSVTVFEYDRRGGTLNAVQTVSTLPADFTGQSTCAEIQVHPSGRFVFASNRGHDSIATFKIEGKSGKLVPLGFVSTAGRTPRHFTIDPSGRWLLVENQSSDAVVVFTLDPETGLVTPTGYRIEVGAPVCAVFAVRK
jgi:6-phosphogluconolactonase